MVGYSLMDLPVLFKDMSEDAEEIGHGQVYPIGERDKMHVTYCFLPIVHVE